ncbi:protein phosphatase 2C domain-containing protein [Anabaena sp. UHCC 0451]|uniref:protein phosphatase 2C domain-containing protein n=1 Tax=Anabaena sp. UHCC 0451 TaxID=2055235 RepID=UPI002B1FFAE6|nr:protein phosphatase 2C domain-containing protein [Anabaena sp. UHCC 0451]MEA5578217.1 protein phosphatase 2C domain-containing protein [Anabaena sp. UHCC 0451]
MENDAATLYCPNEYCQAANPLTHKFCQRCSTPLPKRYLRAVGDSLSLGSPGEILADRYLIIGQSIIVDLKPGLLPQIPELDNLEKIKAYLKLIPYRLHIPQVYGIVYLNEKQSQSGILLLEKPPLLANSTETQVNLCSELTTAWGDASSMRQINWLWQIAHLWQPFSTEGVGSSLLDPHLIRVEGALVRLLELRFDSPTAPKLSELGEFWQQLLKNTKPAIAEFLKQISDALIEGEINSSEQLITVLDQALAGLGTASSGRNSPTQSTTIKIITQTDTGPSRQRNEDACYPPSGVLVSKPPQQNALAIVCDGIGGHEGGNIASNLAIETIQQQVIQLTSVPYENIDPLILLGDLEQSVAIVNDKISQRNDTEQRQGRQRMGTTLVMALPIAHEMYITHIGDSRAYWITRHGCYQVTLDDDVASREVRLGYAVYREALQHSGSGSLVQALGMSKSASLHPTSQRFIIDEDAVFLLTSDGLSDFDRIEDCWETEILPILTGETNIENVASRLIEIANTKNGHDNVTIALVHYQVNYLEPDIILKAEIPTISASKTVDLTPRTTNATTLNNSHQQTQVIPETKSARAAKIPLQLLILLVVLLAAASLGLWIKIQREPEKKTIEPLTPFVSPQTTTKPTPQSEENQPDLPTPPVSSPAEPQ